MVYTLKKIVTKQENEIWNVYLNIDTSIDSQFDMRDNPELYNAEERLIVQAYFSKCRENITDYLGWNRSYIGTTTLEIMYMFDSESSARTYYSRIITSNYSNESRVMKEIYADKKRLYNIPEYTTTWKLLDENLNELEL